MSDIRERLARTICAACHENPDATGDARGNEFRWQDYLTVSDAVMGEIKSVQAENERLKVEVAIRDKCLSQHICGVNCHGPTLDDVRRREKEVE